MASIISSGTTSGTALNMTADTSGQLQLATGASATTAVTIDTSQNVGIGTTSPAVKLDINGQTIIRNQLNIFTGYALALNDSTNVNTYYLQNASSNLQFIYNSTERMRIDSNGNVLVTNVAGLGYGTGSGGTVTQATSKGTGVTLNKPTGQITMNNAALAANTEVGFVLTNSIATVNDTIIVNPANTGGPSMANYNVRAAASAGVVIIYVKNISAGSLSDALVINFAIIKGAIA